MGKKGKAGDGTRKTAEQQPNQKVSRAQRLEMIRTAAYHLAEKRGFKPGAEMADWLEAERDLKDPTSTEDH
jgi:hypothetical protein